MTQMRFPLCAALAVTVLFAVPLSSVADDRGNNELVQLIVNLLGDSDKDMRALGLDQVRTEVKGEAATKQFASQLNQLSADAQVGLLSALADRGDPVARTAVLELLDATGDESVRIAAVRALGVLGETADIPRFVALLSEGSDDEQSTARASLVRLPGESVAGAIVAHMRRAPAETQVALIQVLTARRALDAIPELLKAAVGSNSAVRAAAMNGLGQLAAAEHIPGMVQGVLQAAPGAEQAAAEKNVMFVCSRTKAPQDPAAALLAAMDRLSPQDRVTLLSTLGRVGGPAALKVVERALSDRQQHSAGLRALCNWPDASVAPQLIEIVETDKHRGHATTALRALIRMAPLPDGRTDQQKLDLLKQTMKMCDRDDERMLVLNRASAVRIPETLRFVLPYLDQPRFTEQACQTIVELAHHRNLREPNEAEFHQALDRVIATSKDATVIDRANRYKRDETWVRPK